MVHSYTNLTGGNTSIVDKNIHLTINVQSSFFMLRILNNCCVLPYIFIKSVSNHSVHI